MVLSCGDWSRTSVCCLSGAAPYIQSSPILMQLAHRGFFSQHWSNRVSNHVFVRQLPYSSYFHFARLAHQAASARFAMTLDAPPLLRRKAVIAAIAPTLTRVVSGVLRWCCAVHGVRRKELGGLQKTCCWPDLLTTRDHVMGILWRSLERHPFAFASRSLSGWNDIGPMES